MAKKKKVPEIRFKGFSGEWEETNWKESVDISTNMVDPKDGSYDDVLHIGPGNIESFTGKILNNVLNVGESNLISGKFHFSEGDIIYGKINPQLAKYTIAPKEGLASADAYILRSKNGIAQSFLYTILQTSDFYEYSVSVSARTGMPKINRDELNVYSYNAPQYQEQSQIGNFFQNLDSLIALNQRKYDKLRTVKKSMLEKMFPKDGADVPEIRFKGFMEKWEDKKIGYVISDYTERTTIQNQYPVLTSSQQQGVVLQEDYFSNRQITTEKNIGYFVLPEGYFTYRSRSDTKLFVFNRNNIIEKGIISYYYPVFSVKGVDSNFFLLRINHGLARQINIVAEGTGQHVLAHSKFKKMKALFPGLEEQKKIGYFFQKLDSLVSLQQHKLTKLKNIKKACLEKMFI